MASETLPFTLTWNNNYYVLSQPANNDLVLNIPAAEADFYAHPSIPNYFIFDKQNTFDYTKCTSAGLVGLVSRDAFFAAVIMLNTSGPISGTVAVSNFPNPQNVAQSGLWTVGINNFPASQSVTQGTIPWVTSGSITNFPSLQNVNETQIGGSAYTLGQKIAVSSAPVVIASDQSALSVLVNNFPATTPISGTVTALQGTSPWITSGTVTSNQGTSPWVTSVGNFPATQNIAGSVSVSNFPVSQTVNGTVSVTQPVAVSQSGAWSVTANQGTSPWVTSGTSTVSGSVNVGNFPALQNVNETQIGGATYALGQTTMAASAPVTIASNQSSLPVTVGNFPATTAVTQSTTPWVVNETQIGGSAYSLGQKTSALSAPVVISSDQSSLPVSVANFPATQVVSGTVTANQGGAPWSVNETQIGGSSYTLGQKTSATSAPVVISSDQPPVTVNQGTSPWVTSASASVPATADIVGASRTTTGTLVVIPVGRTFYGSLSISCSISLAGSALPTISVTGTGVVPASGSILHQVIAIGLALTVTANSNTITNVYIYGGTSGGATVTFTQAAAGSSTGQIAGRLL